MVNEKTINCLRESEADTIEISLKKKVEDLLSEGKADEAEEVESTLKNLDKINICEERVDTKGFSMMMRDRSRNL